MSQQQPPTNSRRSNWIAVGVMVLAVAAYIVLFFLPKMRAASALAVQIESKQAFVQESERARLLCQQVERDLQETVAYNRKHAPQLVRHDELPAIYGQISRIAKSHEVTTPRFEPLPAVEYESFHKRQIGMGVTGSFTAIHRLIRDLEALPARLWISDVKFRGPREPGKPVECDLMLVVFVDNPEKTD